MKDLNAKKMEQVSGGDNYTVDEVRRRMRAGNLQVRCAQCGQEITLDNAGNFVWCNCGNNLHYRLGNDDRTIYNFHADERMFYDTTDW